MLKTRTPDFLATLAGCEMKNTKKITICVAGWLVWCLAAHANEPVQTTNPYAAIAARNIFGLESSPPPPPVVSSVEMLPKLLPNGIITVFGRAQVLFIVEAGQTPLCNRAEKTCYIMGEGEHLDGVQVMHIDVLNGVVTFNNHGTVQQIPLARSSINTTETGTPPTPAQMLFNPSKRNG